MFLDPCIVVYWQWRLWQYKLHCYQYRANHVHFTYVFIDEHIHCCPVKWKIFLLTTFMQVNVVRNYTPCMMWKGALLTDWVSTEVFSDLDHSDQGKPWGRRWGPRKCSRCMFRFWCESFNGLLFFNSKWLHSAEKPKIFFRFRHGSFNMYFSIFLYKKKTLHGGLVSSILATYVLFPIFSSE